MKSFCNRLALRRRRRTIDQKRFNAGAAKLLRERNLGLKKLGEDNRAAFPARERLEQFALSAPGSFEGSMVLPGAGCGRVRKFLEALTPGGGTAAGSLQKETAPHAGLAWVQLRQSLAEFLFPSLPEYPFGLFGFKQHRLGTPEWEIDSCIRACIANHHLANQTAKFFRFARLSRALRIDKTGAKFFWAGQLTRLKKCHQVVKFLQRILDRRGRQQ